MLSQSETQQVFSDDAIQQFLLGRLRGKDQSAFERALFLNSELEQRTRLEEIALADDYATHRLCGKDLSSFVAKFPFATARRNQIEVSRALGEYFAAAGSTQPRQAFVAFTHPVWKLAFATMILIMVFATIWLATKEPRIVNRFIPHRINPAAATTPAPEVAHHSENASEPRTHRDQEMPPPGHELSNETLTLDETTPAENAPTLTLATIQDKRVHAQLLLREGAQSSYLAELIKGTGEVVCRAEELAVDANADRVTFDIPIQNLAIGEFQIKLTRTLDGKQAVYFLRVK